ncbi:hypothetical protein NL676_001901 [Syzygium grande]|nr:hypothetical protein NL676_001901 [Syzygium grande]
MARAWLTAVALSLAAVNAMDTAPFIGRMLGGGRGSLGLAVEQRFRRKCARKTLHIFLRSGFGVGTATSSGEIRDGGGVA